MTKYFYRLHRQLVTLTSSQNDSVVTPGSEDVTEDNQADSSQQDRYPKRTRNKPKHLEEFVLDGDLEDITNYRVD